VNDAEIHVLMSRAVRIAVRGHGSAEPNPMVGCVIACDDGTVVAEGFHARCGGPHAEAAALAAAGTAARGATAIVTLEPCNHHGRTGPCSEALLGAGVARVVYAVADPNPKAAGGAAHLQAAGIEARHLVHQGAVELARPFVKRVTSGLPWVMAKWAQSIDGRTALSSGESQWISGGRSRAMVHRERGRVDAIMTGIGTVLEDDPRLTARGTRVHRVARRVVFDPACETPLSAQICDGTAPTTLLVASDLDARARDRRQRLASRGVGCIELGPALSIEPALRALASEGVATVLVESGGGLTGRLLAERLLDEAWVFVGPLVIGDTAAPGAVRGLDPRVLAAIPRARLLGLRRRGDDALLHYRFASP
jgi:diaminohydroxyphosphoribosylaminopyrimidine deaminase/5-amino-6-(5-phosphoribosylamino)uracil reductase